MSLFKRVNMISHSGIPLDWKIDCDGLSDEDIETLAWIIANRFTFNVVEGIPNGGKMIEKALSEYCNPESDVLLIVDDVLTTGHSMEAERRLMISRGWKEDKIQGVVIFARGKCPNWVAPVFSMAKVLLKYC